MTEKSIDVEFRNVSKHYGDVKAVDDISFTVEKGAFHSFLGASGCGKTTCLRMIAGLDQATKGEILLQGKSIVGVPAHERHVNMLFQSYALFPHMTVKDNVIYGLKYQVPKLTKGEMYKLCDEMLEMVRMGGYQNRRIWELSGGQQQRVALARALINKPTVLLLDEPLSALDRKLRKEMQSELLRLQREVGITFVVVTHDQEEALSMSDSISIVHEGRIIQNSTPQELYEFPGSRYVADFIGQANFIEGKVKSSDNNQVVVETDNSLVMNSAVSPNGQSMSAGDACAIAIRPEMICIFEHDNDCAGLDVRTKGVVQDQVYLGDHTEYVVATESFGDLNIRVPRLVDSGNSDFSRGSKVAIGWSSQQGLAIAV